MCTWAFGCILFTCKLLIDDGRQAGGDTVKALSQVLDALDVETYFLCQSELEGRKLMLDFLKGAGFKDVDIVFAEHSGPGARVRGRAYVHRPADKYGWCAEGEQL